MKCREVRRLLYLYREGEISHETWQQIQDHAGSCERCAEDLRLSKSTDNFIRSLGSAEPRLHAQDELTDRIMLEVNSIRLRDAHSRGRGARHPFWRLQIACTVAAAAIVAAFFVQNVKDASRMSAMESRLDRRVPGMTASADGPALASLGLSTMAGIGDLISQSSTLGSLTLDGLLHLREAEHSFFDVLREGTPGIAGEVDRLRWKYPELWAMSPRSGFTAGDRSVLSSKGKALVNDLHNLLQPGMSNDEK